MNEEQSERERCIAIVESHIDGASIETRRTLTRIINEMRQVDSTRRVAEEDTRYETGESGGGVG